MAYNGKEGTSRRNRRYHEQHDTPIVYDDRSEDEHADMVLTPFGQTSVENVDRRQVETEFDLSEDQFADLDNVRSISDEQAYDYGNQLAMGANDALPEDVRYWTEQDHVAVRMAERQIADDYAAKAATAMSMLKDEQKARLEAGEEIGRGSARLQMDGDTLLYTDGKTKDTYPLQMDHVQKVGEERKQAAEAAKVAEQAQRHADANQRVNDQMTAEIQQAGQRAEMLRAADEQGRIAIQAENQKAADHADFLQTVESIDNRLAEEASHAFYEHIKASVAAQENEGKEISPSNSEQTADVGSQSSYSLTAAERLKVQGDGAMINDGSYSYRYHQETDTIGRFEQDGTPAGRRSFDDLHARQVEARDSRHERAETVEQGYKDRGEERPQTAVEELRAMGEGGEMTFGKNTYRLDFETNEVVRFDEHGSELRRVGAQEIQDFQVLKMEDRRVAAEQAQQAEAAQTTEQQPAEEAQTQPQEPQFDAPTFEEQTVDMDAVQHSREQAAALEDNAFETEPESEQEQDGGQIAVVDQEVKEAASEEQGKPVEEVTEAAQTNDVVTEQAPVEVPSEAPEQAENAAEYAPMKEEAHEQADAVVMDHEGGQEKDEAQTEELDIEATPHMTSEMTSEEDKKAEVETNKNVDIVSATETTADVTVEVQNKDAQEDIKEHQTEAVEADTTEDVQEQRQSGLPEQREDVQAAMDDAFQEPKQTQQEQDQQTEKETAQQQGDATEEAPQQRPDVAAAMADFEDSGKQQEAPAKEQEQASEMGNEATAPEQSEAPQEEQRADVQAAMDDFEAETSAPRSEPAPEQEDEHSMAA